ncbi:MAG: dTDP-4-dehydrorhamnose reductase [Nitrospirae bacterium]|nr:dTDP-4-dehydrorhamnose reductase [Nitrospirota bacterium]
MRYLISGKNGQLAQAFIRRFREKSIDFAAPDESQFDITDLDKVTEIVDSYKPDVIINCAAYNLVDRAEQENDKAFNINASGPKHLAYAAQRYNAFFVHFGSDYVFDGLKENGLYKEDDVVNPLNAYGKSKLLGERLIQEEVNRYLILRLSWVFGEGRQNFIYKLIEWSRDSEYLRVACDEFSVPTYTHTVADITLRALDRGISGLYHLTNSGFCSRYEWARLILNGLGIDKFIRPVSMDTFDLPAKRPRFSAMSNEKICELLDIDIPLWEEGVKVFLRERNL